MKFGMFKSKKSIFVILLAVLCIAVTLVFYRKKPILIGFSAQLTGDQAELGVQERNGVELAVEDINKSGGIGGRKVELIVKDDYGRPIDAAKADKELVSEGAIAIIGHATTNQTLAGLKVTNNAKVVMISPTCSTPLLSGIDDYFFRVYPSFLNSSHAFAEYVYKKEGLKEISVVYDSDNIGYSKTYYKEFEDQFVKLGGMINASVGFSSSSQLDYSKIIQDLKNKKTEGILIIASDNITAIIAQQCRIMNFKVSLFTSAWAQTQKLIDLGGKAVENLKIEQSYAPEISTPQFKYFKARFVQRYGQNPTFGAAFGYDAAEVLFKALKNSNGGNESVKKALLSVGEVNGLTDKFGFDRYGDVKRPFYISKVNDGKFIVIGKLSQ